jgi:hypothetical protein
MSFVIHTKLEFLIHISNQVVLTQAVRVLDIILFVSALIFVGMLTGTVSASISDDYCFDHDLEDSLCYETQKACENERKNDLMAESECYKARE